MTKLECPQVLTDSGGHFGGHLGYRTKREFDKSNPYMKFGGNRVIND